MTTAAARRPRWSLKGRGRIAVVVGAVILVVLLLSARTITSFYIDYLWHDSLDRTDVFWGQLRAKVWMFALFGLTFGVAAVLNLVIADRLAPLEFSANTHPLVERFHQIFGRRLRLFRIAVAVVFGLLFSVPAIGQWQEWLMFRNAQAFGVRDPQFDNDIGFYLFRLPFITFAVDWLFAALVIITLMVIGTHVLNGGIVIQPPRPKIRKATKAHIAVLLALLALVKAADYWLSRYELTTESRGVVRGALYSAVNYQLPAIRLLALIAVFAALVFLSTLRTHSWRWPIVVCALWAVVALIGGVIYPAVLQRLVVQPNQESKEAPYIERNVLATRHALGIDNVEVVDIEVDRVATGDLEASVDVLRDVRLLDPERLLPRFKTDEERQASLAINDLDVDRYEVDGATRQVVLGARELNVGGLANKSWQGRHLLSTHGCGVTVANAGQVEANSNLPAYDDPGIDRPELYFSDRIDGFAIVNTSVSEQECPGQTDPGEYSGDGGVLLSSTWRRMAFALSFLDYNVLGSSAVDDESRLMWIRQVRDRVEKLAPFLTYDSDPYPVVIGGRVVWVIDAYTTSDRYPYAEGADLSQLRAGSGLVNPFNYIRNSVKAVVDGYDGSVSFYVVDSADPVVQVWQSAYPDLFTAASEMPAELVDHLRYPEDLFRVQSAAYSKYQLEPEEFFNRQKAWSVAQQPPRDVELEQTADGATPSTTSGGTSAGPEQAFSVDASGERFVPYYTMFRATPDDEATFRLVRPFTPFSENNSRRQLQAYMTATSDSDSAALTVYRLSSTDLPPGPINVYAAMQSDPAISEKITPLAQRGSNVAFGNMQLVPVGDGIVWLMPMYVSDQSVPQPTYRFMLAFHDGRAAFGESIEVALSKLFSGLSVDVGDIVGTTSETPTEPTEPTDATPTELLEQADELFAEAEAELKATGDLGAYQAKIDQAKELVSQALALLTATE